MANMKARLSVITAEERTDIRTFTHRLAMFANQYAMEIAKPIMEHSRELYEDAAIVMLVDKWHDADKRYRDERTRYLERWADYDQSDELSFEPMTLYEFNKEDRNNYGRALYALLVR